MSRQRRFTGRVQKPFLNVWPASFFIALVLVSFSLPSQGSSEASKSEEAPSSKNETLEYSYEESSSSDKAKRNASLSGEDSLEEFESEESAYYRKRRQLFREDIPHHRPLSGNTYAQHHGFPHAGRFNENGGLIVPPMPNPASAHHDNQNNHNEHEHDDDFIRQNEIIHEYPVEYGKFLHHSHGHEVVHHGGENYAPAHGYGPPEHHAIVEQVPHHQSHPQNHHQNIEEEYIPVFEKPKEVINHHNPEHHGHGHHHELQGYRPNYGNVEVLPIPIPLPVYHGGHYKSHRHNKYRHHPRPKYRHHHHKRPRHHHHHYQLYPIRHYGRHRIIHIPIIRYGVHRNKGHKGAFTWFADFPLRRKHRRRRTH